MIFNTVCLQEVMVTLQKAEPESSMPRLDNSMKMSHWHEHKMRSMIIELRGYVVGMPKETLSIHKKWPSDWWQAFKERWFPTWAQRRWPVVYYYIDVDQTIFQTVCPHTVLDKREAHISYLSGQGQAVEPWPPELAPDDVTGGVR